MRTGFEAEIDDYERHLMSLKRSPHTVKTYSLAVEGLLAFCGKDPEEITPKDTALYQQHLALEKGLSKNSLYTAVEALTSYFKFLGTDASVGLTRPRRPGQAPRYITEEEVKLLLETASKRAPRDHLMISLLVYTGLRVSELCTLEIADIDANSRTIVVRSGKGDRDRMVILPEPLMAEIADFVKKTAVTGHLFQGGANGHVSPRCVQMIVKRCAKEAGIEKKVTPHVLRHTFATSIIRKGGDIRFIQQLLGHKSVATTQIYTHLDDTMIRRMYDQYGPEY